MKLLSILSSAFSFGGFCAPSSLACISPADTSVLILNKDDISTFKISNSVLYVDKNEKNIKKSVYLKMAIKNPNYSNFFLMLAQDNGNNFMVVGDDFAIPESGKIENYTVDIFATQSNQSFIGNIQLFISLSLDEKKIDLNSISNITTNGDNSTYINTNNIVETQESVSTPNKNKVLEEVDKYMLNPRVGQPDPRWVENNNLLLQNSESLSFSFDQEKDNDTSLSEKFYSITIGVTKNSNDFTLGTSCKINVRLITRFKEIKRDIFKGFHERIGSNWSTTDPWSDQDNEVMHNAQLNLRQYVTKQDIVNNNNGVTKAFANTYNNIKFSISGEFTNVHAYKTQASNVYFDMTDIQYNQIFSEISIDDDAYHGNDHGSGTLIIRIKVDANNDFYYAWSCTMHVTGYGGSYSHTEFNVDISNLSISLK
ncbi:hypothetical protein [Spiroplasma endosymbiont of Aspidapion aeneum]|uniref:hypothetical protein n=1 Tax=Spiroplasma endosymbiont of Aspidapion aeneum TaxID=3066276 RepID=UPI00313EFB33